MSRKEHFDGGASEHLTGIPPALGEAPLPEGHVRMYHQTPLPNAESIRSQGLLYDKARGIEGPKGTWVSDKPFYKNSNDMATVEIAVPEEQRKRIGRIGTMGDVPPSQILTVSEPWHDHLRDMLTDNRYTGAIHRGEFDDVINNDWNVDDPAVKAAKYIRDNGIGK
jgi:hypothetical protein